MRMVAGGVSGALEGNGLTALMNGGGMKREAEESRRCMQDDGAAGTEAGENASGTGKKGAIQWRQRR